MIIEQNTAGAPTATEATAALRASPLFAEASDAEVAVLALSCRVESVAAGTVVIREGDEADDLYLLLSGELLSYTYDDLGREIALERISGVDQPVGEQAFLNGARRSSSVKAVTESRVVRMPGGAFRKLLARDEALGRHLREIGAKQIRKKVSQQMALLRRLAAGPDGSPGWREETFPDGAVVCQQGELGRELYVIVSGSARVFRTEPGGRIVQLARLQSGQSFGELSLIEGGPRMATVAADGELAVLTIAGDDFRNAYEADAQVRSHAAALRSIYSYAGSGIVVQFAAELFDRAALGTLYRLNDGRVVASHRIYGQDVWSIQQADAPADAVELAYADPVRGVERTLLVADSVVVGAVIKGAWSEVGELYGRVLERKPFLPSELEAFRRTGELTRPPDLAPVLAPADDTVICQCMRVTRGALAVAMQRGCQTVAALSARTGAGSVCGGCVPQLAELTAESLWQTVLCTEVIERAPRVRSFRLAVPPEHRAAPVKPGQHLVVQALIRGVSVQRSYTLTSPASEGDYYEITVQREPHGVMSAWLFDNLHPGTTLAILPPSGTCFFELSESRPLVCLVGGIGITPALAICRSAAAVDANRRVHVDYSSSTRADVVCGDEFASLAASDDRISFNARITREQRRLGAADLAALSVRFPNADWLVCGSRSFQTDIQRLLLGQGAAPRSIHIESFDAVGAALPTPPAATAVLSPWQRRLAGYGLLIAIAAFVVQALIGIKWPLLGRLQATTAYSAVTGSGLLVLLMLQWHLGYVRWRNRALETSCAYGLHIAIGPAVLGMMWLHSTHLGYALSMAVSLSFLLSLATGAVLGAHPRSPRWDGLRRALLCLHIVLSCAGSGFALTHAFTALWY
jgi:ferredoxin-NADP reductase/CRP-like cAMP-binding protein